MMFNGKMWLFKLVASKNMKKLPTSLLNCYLREQPKNDSLCIKICKIFLTFFIQYSTTITYESICTQPNDDLKKCWSLLSLLTIIFIRNQPEEMLINMGWV